MGHHGARSLECCETKPSSRLRVSLADFGDGTSRSKENRTRRTVGTLHLAAMKLAAICSHIVVVSARESGKTGSANPRPGRPKRYPLVPKSLAQTAIIVRYLPQPHDCRPYC